MRARFFFKTIILQLCKKTNTNTYEPNPQNYPKTHRKRNECLRKKISGLRSFQYLARK